MRTSPNRFISKRNQSVLAKKLSVKAEHTIERFRKLLADALDERIERWEPSILYFTSALTVIVRDTQNRTFVFLISRSHSCNCSARSAS